jgi:hypothetical protein
MSADVAGYYEEDRKGGRNMPEPINVKCPSCHQVLAADDEGGLVSQASLEHGKDATAYVTPHARELLPRRRGAQAARKAEG